METTISRLRNYIGGESLDHSGPYADVLNPATGEAIAEVPLSSKGDVDRAVSAAREAFRSWGDTTPSERQEALLEIASLVESHADEFSDLEVTDVGKPRTAFERDEIGDIVNAFRFYAGAARMLEGKAAGEYVRDRTSMIRREPAGVVGHILPWNYPLMMAAWNVGAALAAGCTMVVKPSEHTPLSTFKLAELTADVLPPGVLNVVGGIGPEAGAALVEHADVDVISLIGSIPTGKWIARTAAETLKRVHLELGGKAPVIVFDDADLELVIAKIGEMGYYNAGQDCTIASRVLVSDRLHDDFVAGLSDEAKQLRIGDTADPETTLGPVSSERQRDRIEGFLDRAPAHAEIVTGGRRVDRPGFFLEPTVIVGLKQDDEIVQDEIFGPVVSVQRFSDPADAIIWANGTRYGLAASVWTQDVKRALRTIKALRFGTVWLNDHITTTNEMPHGGFKQSGYGRARSMYAVEEYTEIKNVMMNFSDEFTAGTPHGPGGLTG